MKQKKLFSPYLILIGISLLALCLRLYRVSAPVADWHSFRQVDTASVARNYVKNGVDLLRPRYDDLSNIQSGKDNPMGWRMVEFPLYQAIAATVTRSIPAVPVEISLRLVNIVAASASVFLLGVLMMEFSQPVSAVMASLIFAVLPFAVFYGRAILPDTFAVFWALLSLVLLTRQKKDRWSVLWVTGGGLAAAIACLAKPTAIFLLLPSLYIIMRTQRISLPAVFYSVLYILISSLPLLWWRRWILQFPEGIPASEWLLNNNNIRFKGAWFYWLFGKRIPELILGYWGLVPFGLGILAIAKKSGAMFRWLFLSGGILYLIIFASGNVQHDYYQIFLIPIIAVFVGDGLADIMQKNSLVSRIGGWLFAGVCVIFMGMFSWYTIRTYYWINRPEIIEAGKMADSLLPQNAKVIAPYNGDTTFLYYTNRSGWPLGFDIDQKIAMGATHYVTVSPTDNDFETMTLAKTYTVLVRNEKFAIIDLTKKQ